MRGSIGVWLFYILVLSICFCKAVQQEKSVRVGFQLDGVARTDSFLRYKKSLPDMTKYSVCFRLKVLQFRERVPIMSYAIDNYDNEILLVFDVTSGILLVSSSDLHISFNIEHTLTIEKQDSLCIAVDLGSSSYKGTINEMIINGTNGKSQQLERNVIINGNGYLYFGQEQDSANGGFSKSDCVSGYIYDLSFYNRLLTEEEMIGFTSCFTNRTISSENLLIDFSDEDDFEISNALFSYEATRHLQCSEKGPLFILFPGQRTFYEAKHFCRALGGRTVIPRNAQENTQLFNFINKHKRQCKRPNSDFSWLGIIANETEKYFQNERTGKKIQYDNLRKDLLTDWVIRKCVTIYGDDMDLPTWHGVWNPISCFARTCVTCYFPEVHVFVLRGLCKKSVFDRQYLIASKNSTYYFKGFFYSFIKYFQYKDENIHFSGYWKIYRLDMPESSAILNVRTEAEYPIGKKLWTTSGDVCKKSHDYLALTICDKEQFTCDDGTCISLDQRCNLEVDCGDTSDELDCLPLILPAKYEQIIPPPREDNKGSFVIKFLAEIHSIHVIDLSKFMFITEITLTLAWRDSRVMFKNLKFHESLNIIENTNIQKQPWIPNYKFTGDQNSTSRIENVITSLHVRRLSDPLPDNDEYVSTDQLFPGSNNDLILRRKFLLTTSCHFEFVFFPFESQICHIIATFGNDAGDQIKVVSDGEGVIFTGKRRLLQYFVKAVVISDDRNGNDGTNSIKFELKNISSFYIINIYIPTLIMLVIGYLPFYFVLEEFNDRIIVSVTSLLVEATFLSQLATTTPKISYMTMIDIWCIFSISILFSNSLLLTLINFVKRPTSKPYKKIKVAPFGKKSDFNFNVKKRSASEVLNTFGIIFYPVVVSVFVLAYITVVLTSGVEFV